MKHNSFLAALAAVDIARRAPAVPSRDVIGYALPEPDLVAPALRPFRPDARVLESKLPGVSHEAWTDFVLAMKVAPRTALSESNALGMFGIRYKRLADLGRVTNVRYQRGRANAQEADWLKPTSLRAFLGSAEEQYGAFTESMQGYFDDLRRGLAMPAGVSVSGSLAILHRAGRRALERWNDDEKFETTLALFNLVNGVF